MHIHKRRIIICLLMLAAILSSSMSVLTRSGSLSAFAHTQTQTQPKRYKIYCVNGKVEISDRNMTDMRAARGSRVCLLESYDSLSETIQATKRYGGVGADCTCPPQ